MFIICVCAHFSFELVKRCGRWMIVILPFMLMFLESFYNTHHHHQRIEMWMWIDAELKTGVLQLIVQIHPWLNVIKKLWNIDLFGRRMRNVHTLSNVSRLKWIHSQIQIHSTRMQIVLNAEHVSSFAIKCMFFILSMEPLLHILS